jgi:hypothetical protein
MEKERRRWLSQMDVYQELSTQRALNKCTYYRATRSFDRQSILARLRTPLDRIIIPAGYFD